MMKRLFAIVFFALMMFCSSSEVFSKDRDFIPFKYELSAAKEGSSATAGYKVFKVWSYAAKKQLLTDEICMRNAIHGLLFMGLVSEDFGTQGSVPALVPDGYASHKDYFDAFFSTGDYLQFIQPASKGAQQAGDVLKMKKEFKVGLLVQVNLSALRKRLEKDGIIKNARSLFRN